MKMKAKHKLLYNIKQIVWIDSSAMLFVFRDPNGNKIRKIGRKGWLHLKAHYEIFDKKQAIKVHNTRRKCLG